jgi:hypothetical protein
MEVSSQRSFAVEATHVLFAVQTYTYHEETDGEDTSHSEKIAKLRGFCDGSGDTRYSQFTSITCKYLGKVLHHECTGVDWFINLFKLDEMF